MISRIGDELMFNAQALTLRAQRQEVLASNLANAETPNYKSRDFDFGSALRAATGAPDPDAALAPLRLATTDRRHLAGEASAGLPVALRYRTPTQASIDGNTVDPDLERTQFADNALRYDAALRMLNGQIQTLQRAIQNN
ncbi:MAG: flagellar basal body rod protein FlgB [Pigmentiphaga sp.]|uniref:flagellar basal body rod protein FlgB n=1 Tax=Pigmentiphaga sp. TaxID=1977564 RepID=UPI0029B66D16|nr:flagellar basal body rod protein FlgB [Pigmentiphaga sp.]MDX3904114.1 flagellar basal body rod protein FlgB [Pigmentiphaga sp.]